MAGKKSKSGTKNTEDNPFTVDSDNSVVMEVPTISRLLNRKKYGHKDSDKEATTRTQRTKTLTRTKTQNTASQRAPQMPIEIVGPTSKVIDLPVEASGLIEIARSSITISSTAKIQAIQPRSSGTLDPILEWDPTTLQQSKDPLARALVQLLQQQKLSGALFLSIKLLSENTLSGTVAQKGVPFFVGTASITPGNKAPYWRGLVWDPSIVPDLWNQFIQDGSVELAPPGPNTVVTSERNVVRAALGTGPKEWVILVRVGTIDVCRGIIALFSDESLASEMGPMSALFFADTQPSKKAA